MTFEEWKKATYGEHLHRTGYDQFANYAKKARNAAIDEALEIISNPDCNFCRETVTKNKYCNSIRI